MGATVSDRLTAYVTWVDSLQCIGCERCVEVLPEVFWMNEEGLAEAIYPLVSLALEDDLLAAVEICPTEAIGMEPVKVKAKRV